jgi:hypothetical protein
MLLIVMGLAVAPCSLRAQAPTKDQKIEPQVILRKLFPPVYSPLARRAHALGDVHLRVSIHSDGSIDAVSVIDGSPVLRQAALDSAKQSQFECKDCRESDHLVEGTFTYSFRVSPEQEPADSNCCLEDRASPDKVLNTQASQSDERITIAISPVCICSAEYLGTLMDRRMRLIAGNDALDCGRVKLSADPKASLACAHQAISKKRAFFVRLDSVGMDSFFYLTDSLATARARYTASRLIASDGEQIPISKFWTIATTPLRFVLSLFTFGRRFPPKAHSWDIVAPPTNRSGGW